MMHTEVELVKTMIDKAGEFKNLLSINFSKKKLPDKVNAFCLYLAENRDEAMQFDFCYNKYGDLYDAAAYVSKNGKNLIIDNIEIDFAEWMSCMKFDCIVMNPPYERDLHLKILEAVIPHAEKVVNISPNLWFTRRGSKQLKTYKESIANHIIDNVYISTEEAHMLFPDTTSWMSLSILTCDKNNEKCAFDIDNYWKRFYTDVELSILNKVVTGETFSNAPAKKNALMTAGVYVPLSYIAGGRGNKPIYKYDGIVVNGRNLDGVDWVESWNVNPKHKKKECQKSECRNDCLQFKTVCEAKNFYDSWNTKFMTWMCEKTVQQQHIKPEYLPYMQDYTKPWTDKRFCDYFKITGYIDDNTAVPGSEWETILNSVTKK